MKRRSFIAGSGLLLAPAIGRAQQGRKVFRIGRLSPLSAASEPPIIEGLRQGLRDLGWLEGTHFELVFRFANGEHRRLPGLAAELDQLGVDLIVAGSNAGAVAAKRATSTIPIVMVTTGNPLADNLVVSLAKPGGNVTGVTTMGLELNAKRLELLKDIFPHAIRWAFLTHPSSPYTPALLKDGEAAARSLSAQLQIFNVRDDAGFEDAFTSMTRERIEALIVPTGILFITHRVRIVELAAQNRLPAIYAERSFVDVGGFVFYGASLANMYRHAATHVDKILKGAKAGELPVEQPSKFDFVVNLKAAKALGLVVPEFVLLRADEVIE